MSTSRWMDKEAVIHLYNGILLSQKNKCIWVSPNEEDEPRACYTEWNKSEKQISYVSTYIWNVEKWCWWPYLQGGSRDADRGVETWPVGKERVGQLRQQHRQIHAAARERDSQWGAAAWHRGLSWRSVTTWEGGAGREAEGADICILMAWGVRQKPTQHRKQLSNDG